jgi:hypothetical protein
VNEEPGRRKGGLSAHVSSLHGGIWCAAFFREMRSCLSSFALSEPEIILLFCITTEIDCDGDRTP